MSTERVELIKSALGRMQTLCSKSEKSSGDIREKLKAYSLFENEVNDIIETLQEENFIDDKRYCNFFCRDKFKFNHWGRIKIRQSLKLKGIDSSIINDALALIDEDDYYSLILKLINEKNQKISDENIYSRKGKLFRFAASKGFESELIYRVIDEVI